MLMLPYGIICHIVMLPYIVEPYDESMSYGNITI